VLVLFLMYLGLIALWRTNRRPRPCRPCRRDPDAGRRRQPSHHQILGRLWNTLHQPASVVRIGGPTIDTSLLVPLFVMAVAFSLLFITLHFAAMRNEIMRRRVRTLLLTQAERA